MRGLEGPEGQVVVGGADLSVEVARRPGAHAAVAEEATARRHGEGFGAPRFCGGAVGRWEEDEDLFQ
jgi:hypothetical protein